MENSRTHIIHDRTNQQRRTIGYRVFTSDNGQGIHIKAAEARCHPNDNFCKRSGRLAVNGRLDLFEKGMPAKRTFTMDALPCHEMPRNADEWRSLEEHIVHHADVQLEVPAALRKG